MDGGAMLQWTMVLNFFHIDIIFPFKIYLENLARERLRAKAFVFFYQEISTKILHQKSEIEWPFGKIKIESTSKTATSLILSDQKKHIWSVSFFNLANYDLGQVINPFCPSLVGKWSWLFNKHWIIWEYVNEFMTLMVLWVFLKRQE